MTGDERELAIALFNETWALLDNPERTPEADDRMIHAAHASRFHWDNVGTDENRAIGEWQVSRVYAVLGRPEPALFHARRALKYARRPGVPLWVSASAEEGFARARLAAGDAEGAWLARDRALGLLEDVDDPQALAVVAADIASLPFD